jgi:hypothetical protein
MARELREKRQGSSKHTSTEKSLQTLPQNLPPIPPSARSRMQQMQYNPAIPQSTVSPLLNKRVRGVVDEANGLMHLRPRESTYSAQEYNAAQSIGMNCALLSIKVRIGRKSGGEAGKAHTNGHAIPCSRGVACALSRADGLLRAAVAPVGF